MVSSDDGVSDGVLPGGNYFEKAGKTFEFSVADGLVLVLAAIVAVTYNWQMNPEPEKMLFGGQLVISWFVLRFIFTGWPLLRVFFLMGVCRDRID